MPIRNIQFVKIQLRKCKLFLGYKMESVIKEKQYILISFNFRYKREELCPALIYIYWDSFVRIHQGSIIKCVDVIYFFGFSFLKMNVLIQNHFVLPINFMVLVFSYVNIYKALLDFPVFMSDLK